VLTEQLQTALNRRVMIEQAKGVLAGRWQVDMDRALDVLRSHFRHHNRIRTDPAGGGRRTA
jgi:hypothetical protein